MPEQPQETVPFVTAPAWLAQRTALHTRASTIIAITGPAGAGKSTLARALSPCILSTDDYLPDYELVPYAQRDEPHHADLALLLQNLTDLAAGRATQAPLWSFHTHRREGVRTIHPAPLIVCEGLHALHAVLAPAIHLRVYVDAAAAVRWQRWERIESSGERGWGVEQARRFFDDVAEPTFARLGPAYRASAHLVVTNPHPPESAVPGGWPSIPRQPPTD